MSFTKSHLTIALLATFSSLALADSTILDEQTEINNYFKGEIQDFTINVKNNLNLKVDSTTIGKNSLDLNGEGPFIKREESNEGHITFSGFDSLSFASKGKVIEFSGISGQVVIGPDEINDDKPVGGKLLQNLTLSSTNDSAIYIEGKSLEPNSMTGSAGQVAAWLHAKNTTITSESKEKAAIHLVGNYPVETSRGTDDNEKRNHGDASVKFTSQEDSSQLTINSPNVAIHSEEGSGFEVWAGSVDINGSLVFRNGSWGDMGYNGMDWLPKEWEEDNRQDEETVRHLKTVKITGSQTDKDLAAISLSQGSLFVISAEHVHINNGLSSKAIELTTDTSTDGVDSAVSGSSLPTALYLHATNDLHIKGDIVIDKTSYDSRTFIAIESDKVIQVRGNLRIVNSGTSDNVLSLKFNGKDSGFWGTIVDEYIKDAPQARVMSLEGQNNSKPISRLDNIGTQIILTNGAQLSLEGNSVITRIDSDGGSLDLGENTLHLMTLTSTGNSLIKTSSVKDQQIKLDKYSGADGKQLTIEVAKAEGVQDPEALKSMISIADEAGNNQQLAFKVQESSSSTGQFVQFDENGNAIVNDIENNTTVAQSLSDIAGLQTLAWRAQINDVNKRLGDLRTFDGQAGGWARVYGGETEYGDRDLENKHTTVQIGADTKILNNYYLGTTASYTDGNGDLINGSTDDRSYSLGVYGGWLSDNGQFLDVIVKATNMKTDFDLAYTSGERSSGSFDTWGTSVALEYGWRFNCPSTNFWVEPQAEVTYGYMNDVNYTTNDGVKAHQDALESLVGRLGVSIGATFDQGSAYLKASVAHDWMSESSIQMSNGLAKLEDDLGGTWGEFAIGGTYNFNNGFVAYGEFQTTTSSDVKSPYQWSAGIRYIF